MCAMDAMAKLVYVNGKCGNKRKKSVLVKYKNYNFSFYPYYTVIVCKNINKIQAIDFIRIV